METLIMHPKTKEQSAALKAVARALKIPFEIKKDSPYKLASLKALSTTDFIPEKSADEILEDLKTARNFTR